VINGAIIRLNGFLSFVAPELGIAIVVTGRCILWIRRQRFVVFLL
jgi:hypothetical protein